VVQAADLQDAICNAATGDALVMVLHRGSQAGLLPQLSSQYLALSCQRLAHFEEEWPVVTLDDFGPVMQHVQVSPLFEARLSSDRPANRHALHDRQQNGPGW